jgi:hypothetical protein
MQNWEYWVETINTEYEMDKDGNIDTSLSRDEILTRCLNNWGSEGWELVEFLTALPAPRGTPQNPYVIHAIFKRKS